jgi:hypothetical protein
MKKNLLLLLAFIGAAYSGVQAQEYRTDISIRDQVLNNAQPGLKYAPAQPAKKTVEEPRIPAYASVRVSQAIREGKMGMPVATNVGNATSQKPVAKTSQGIKLPSEMTTEEIRAVAEAAKQSAAKAKLPVIEQTEEIKEPATEPAKVVVPTQPVKQKATEKKQ